MANKKLDPYVHSGYERIADDNYQTIDGRCIDALTETVHLSGTIADCCANQGSGIVDGLLSRGYKAICISDAFTSRIDADVIVTNPPYTKKLVDEILYRQIQRICDGELKLFAALLRANFDFAKSRHNMFQRNSYYVGQIKMCFRPVWIEPKPGEKKIEPIHNYVWHFWHVNQNSKKDKIVKYWYEK